MSLLLSPVSRDPAGDGARLSWGVLIGACGLPALGIYLAAVAVLVTLTAAAGTEISAASADGLGAMARLGAMGWLIVHHVPLTIDGAPLGVLPLLPTLLGGALVARGAAKVAARHGISQPGDAGWVAGVIAGIHSVLGAALALVATPVTVTADPALAAVVCALVAGAAAGVGLIRPCGLLPAALRQAPCWVRPGLDSGLWGLAVLLAAGLTTTLLAVAVSAPEVFQMSSSDAGSVFGLTALSIGYLPNAAIAGLSWLAGPGFSIGGLAISLFAVHPGPVPAIPLLAALPQDPAPGWLDIALVVPLLAGAAVGRRCAAAADEPPQRFRILAVAATVMALGSAILGALAGGQLGAAAFNPVEVPFGLLMVAVLATTLLGGAATLLLPFRGMEPELDRASARVSDRTDQSTDQTNHTDKEHDGEADSASGNSALPELNSSDPGESG